MVPFELVLAVPVIRPLPSRLHCPLLSVLTVPVMRPLALRNVDCCADAVVVTASMASTVTKYFIALRGSALLGVFGHLDNEAITGEKR